MLEEFRQQAEMAFFTETPEQETAEAPVYTRPASKFLGLTPVQRLLVAFLLLGLTVLLSALCLLVTGKIVPPFLY